MSKSVESFALKIVERLKPLKVVESFALKVVEWLKPLKEVEIRSAFPSTRSIQRKTFNVQHSTLQAFKTQNSISDGLHPSLAYGALSGLDIATEPHGFLDRYKRLH